LTTGDKIVDAAFTACGKTLADIDAVAVTNRPGLIGSLLIGAGFAQGLSFARGLPLIPVDHIAAHIYSTHLTNEIPFP
jgi:N6-L-threonylcarbamoyladenine synthase